MKHVRELQREARKHGADLTVLRYGKHVVMRCTVEGKSENIVVSSSPGKGYATQNMRATLKRTIRHLTGRMA